MKLDMNRPCVHCPFRTDVEPYIRYEHARMIIRSLVMQEESFPCHLTTVANDDDCWDDQDANSKVVTADSQHCAGAMIFLMHIRRPNLWMQVAARMHWFNPYELDMSAPVFSTVKAFLAHFRHDKETQ